MASDLVNSVGPPTLLPSLKLQHLIACYLRYCTQPRTSLSWEPRWQAHESQNHVVPGKFTKKKPKNLYSIKNLFSLKKEHLHQA
jgi:hypothetical protein